MWSRRPERARAADRPASPAPRDPLRLIDEQPSPVLALVHPELLDQTPRLPAGTTVVALPCTELPEPAPWGTVLLMAPDRDALQRLVPLLPRLRRARTVGIHLGYAHEVVPLTPLARWEREWGPQAMVTSRRRGTEFVNLARFTAGVNPRAVLAEFARQAVRRSLTPHQGLRVAVHPPAMAPPGEVHALSVADLADAGDDARDVPPDVVISREHPGSPLPAHHVTGRAPVLVDDRAGPLALGPLDERILNPQGFERAPTEPMVPLVESGGTLLLRVPEGDLSTSAARGATEQMVRALRPHLGAEVTWPAEPSPGLARTVAGLAMAGVPLVCADPPTWAADLLGSAVHRLLATPADLGDELAREEASVELRRAALREFSMPAWRARVAEAAGLRPPATPSVSVVLATRRPERLEHALAQVRRQRGVALELVLAPHGFRADPRRVSELAGDQVRTVLVPRDAEVLFGDVLAGAADAASGDVVVKMDDDDWYGPDFVTDLLLARDYSGAELVGMPAEFAYLAPLDVTVRSDDWSEGFGRFVAGGTLMVDRSVLRALGSFRPVRRYVDASLLADLLAAGGSVYRTHGLGYVLHRGDSGHTWEAEVDSFLEPDRLRRRWDGFVPSRLLEAGPGLSGEQAPVR